MFVANPLFHTDWRAMILAAGFGSRLRPLTEQQPKPLITVAGVPMLTFALNRLRPLKPQILVVNGHHLSVQLETFLQKNGAGFRRLEYVFEPEILDTGGGILNAAKYLKGPFFVTMNADIVTDIPLAMAVKRHLKSRALVTMLLHNHSSYNQVEVDCHGSVRSFGSAQIASGNRLLAYTGIQICSPLLLDLMSRETVSSFSLIAFYRRLLAAGRLDLKAHIVNTEKGYYWRDLGTHEDLAAIASDLEQDPALAGRLGVGLDF
ncbi:NTP transferase domain-containing protein [bacterium]|nr:NTP transferase domain-containing protein [bacterium]